MQETSTVIMWPEKLKVGSKSKRGESVLFLKCDLKTYFILLDNQCFVSLKDPHVRVAGEPESVRAAKERIMAVLDTRVNQVVICLLPVLSLLGSWTMTFAFN